MAWNFGVNVEVPGMCSVDSSIAEANAIGSDEAD